MLVGIVAGRLVGRERREELRGHLYVFALPKDKWLVCYCGCPHAESGRLADELLASGFTKVTILDEGFFVWRDRGYPVRSGPSP